MHRDGLELKADSALVFDENAGRLVTVGEEATFTPLDGDSVLTRQIIFDLNEDRATAVDAQTTTQAGAGSWLVRGDCPWVDGDRSYCHRLRFTSCEEEEPHYHFLAREIKITPGGTMVARNVILYFADVGVLWLPFIAQSTQTERRSGLLPVRFSVNDVVRTSESYSRRVSNMGYYWAISDYADAEGRNRLVERQLHGGNGRASVRMGTPVSGGRGQFQAVLERGGRIRTRRRHPAPLGDFGAEPGAGLVPVRVELVLRATQFVRPQGGYPVESTRRAGFSRRFDWGNVSVNANRRQFLSDDKVEMTLPTVNLSLSPITLFGAPPNRARFYNNLTWSASGRMSRSIRDLPAQPPDTFRLRSADTEAWRGSFSTSLSAGALSVSQSVNLNRNIVLDVPPGFFDPDTAAPPVGVGSVGGPPAAPVPHRGGRRQHGPPGRGADLVDQRQLPGEPRGGPRR